MAGVAVDPGLEHDGVAEELGRGAVDRSGVDLEGAVDLGEQTVAHHGDLVGEAERLGLVMGDEDRRDAGVVQDLGDGAAGRDPQPGVEGGEGLVEQHELGLAGEGPGERDALLLPARDLVRAARRERRVERDHLEQLGDPGLRGLAAPRAAARRRGRRRCSGRR